MLGARGVFVRKWIESRKQCSLGADLTVGPGTIFEEERCEGSRSTRNGEGGG